MKSIIFIFLSIATPLTLSADETLHEDPNGIPTILTPGNSQQPSNSSCNLLGSAYSSTGNDITESSPTDSQTVVTTTVDQLKSVDKSSSPASSLTDLTENDNSQDSQIISSELDLDTQQVVNLDKSKENNNEFTLLQTESGISQQDVNETYTLILDASNSNQINSYNIYFNDNPARLYVPVKGYKFIKSVINKPIWRAAIHEYAYMVYYVPKEDESMIMILSSGSASNRYCFKNAGEFWIHMSTFSFYRKLMVPFEPEKQFKVYTLDIKEYKITGAIVVKCYLDHLHTIIYSDDIGYKVGEIKYGDQILFKTNFFTELVVKVTVSLFHGFAVLVDIEKCVYGFVKNERYELVNGKWKTIGSLDYEYNLNKYRDFSAVEQELKTNLTTLNLNEPEKNKFSINVRSNKDDISSIEYKPKDNNDIGFIVSDNRVIWTSPGIVKDLLVLVTFKNSKAVLISIENKSKTTCKFLSFEQDTWSELNRSKYNDKMIELYR